MNKSSKIIILGHENPDVDSIVSGYLLEKILNIKGYNAEFVIPDEMIDQNTLDICLRNGLNPVKYQRNLTDLENVKYILVDHNEREVAGEVICIIDHHPTLKNIEIKNYYNNKISSTACFICRGQEKMLTKYDISLAILATLVDTASFHSSKGCLDDRKWAIKMCTKYNIDYKNLYKEGLCLTDLKYLDQASLNGLKKYIFDNKKVESSYIQIENPSKEKEKIKAILDRLEKYLKNKKLYSFVFIIHDMSCYKTMYYLITENNIETKCYDSYTERGNVIMREIAEKIGVDYIL